MSARTACILFLRCMASASVVSAEPTTIPINPPEEKSLWAHDNLFAWAIVPYDEKRRNPEQRALMLKTLGFKSFAYDWSEADIAAFDAEIKVLKREGINLLAWWFPVEFDDPKAKEILEVFKRNNVHPQLWATLNFDSVWRELAKQGIAKPDTPAGYQELSANERAEIGKAFQRLAVDVPKTPDEQQQRVGREADRIYGLAKLAAPYGCKVALYNHVVGLRT